MKWSRQAAEQGHTTAQYNVGLMLKRGLGVSRDKILALVWLELSAENAKTQPCLGCNPAQARDELRKELNQTQVAKAHKILSRCKATNYKQCD